MVGPSGEGQEKIRINIASHTRFHMFDLAYQMVRLKQDVRLYTGYPKWKVDPTLRDIATTHPLPVLISRALRKTGFLDRRTRVADAVYRNFGNWLAQTAAECDVLDALCGCGLEAGTRVQREGGCWLCNCGSPHILFQKSALEEEHARWGVPAPYYSTRGVNRVLAEYGSADRVIVPSEFVRQTFINKGFAPERILKVPYGVDLSIFTPQPRQDKKFRVLFVGRISILKGIGYLLEAMKPLVEAGHAELWLIGNRDPSARDLLAEYSNIFTYKGTYPRTQLAELYSQGSVLVLPSVWEGLALVQAQAMACGLPVIATANTGAGDLFTDGVEGFIVPARDAQAIREWVEYLLAHPDRRQEMGRAALHRVKGLGGWDKYGADALANYRYLTMEKTGREG